MADEPENNSKGWLSWLFGGGLGSIFDMLFWGLILAIGGYFLLQIPGVREKVEEWFPSLKSALAGFEQMTGGVLFAGATERYVDGLTADQARADTNLDDAIPQAVRNIVAKDQPTWDTFRNLVKGANGGHYPSSLNDKTIYALLMQQPDMTRAIVRAVAKPPAPPAAVPGTAPAAPPTNNDAVKQQVMAAFAQLIKDNRIDAIFADSKARGVVLEAFASLGPIPFKDMAGLDRFLGQQLNPEIKAFLQTALSAGNGAIPQQAFVDLLASPNIDPKTVAALAASVDLPRLDKTLQPLFTFIKAGNNAEHTAQMVRNLKAQGGEAVLNQLLASFTSPDPNAQLDIRVITNLPKTNKLAFDVVQTWAKQIYADQAGFAALPENAKRVVHQLATQSAATIASYGDLLTTVSRTDPQNAQNAQAVVQAVVTQLGGGTSTIKPEQVVAFFGQPANRQAVTTFLAGFDPRELDPQQQRAIQVLQRFPRMTQLLGDPVTAGIALQALNGKVDADKIAALLMDDKQRPHIMKHLGALGDAARAGHAMLDDTSDPKGIQRTALAFLGTGENGQYVNLRAIGGMINDIGREPRNHTPGAQKVLTGLIKAITTGDAKALTSLPPAEMARFMQINRNIIGAYLKQFKLDGLLPQEQVFVALLRDNWPVYSQLLSNPDTAARLFDKNLPQIVAEAKQNQALMTAGAVSMPVSSYLGIPAFVRGGINLLATEIQNPGLAELASYESQLTALQASIKALENLPRVHIPAYELPAPTAVPIADTRVAVQPTGSAVVGGR